ncbi:hypothetical protein Plhal304r1_c015g0055601 [Plasmopara halstedii]
MFPAYCEIDYHRNCTNPWLAWSVADWISGIHREYASNPGQFMCCPFCNSGFLKRLPPLVPNTCYSGSIEVF